MDNLCPEPRSSGSPKDALPTPTLVPLDVADTLLCRDGSLRKWVFTNRSGRVRQKMVRKRSVAYPHGSCLGAEQVNIVVDLNEVFSFVMQQIDQQSVSARFLDLSSSCLDGSRGLVAILRLSDGTSRVLSESAFKEVMNVFPSVMRDIVAIQPFLQGMGSMKIMHRCHYFVSENKERVACQIGTISTIPASSASLQKGIQPHLKYVCTQCIPVLKCIYPSRYIYIYIYHD